MRSRVVIRSSVESEFKGKESSEEERPERPRLIHRVEP